MLNQKNLQLNATFVRENAKAIADLFIGEIKRGNKYKLIGFLNKYKISSLVNYLDKKNNDGQIFQRLEELNNIDSVICEHYGIENKYFTFNDKNSSKFESEVFNKYLVKLFHFVKFCTLPFLLFYNLPGFWTPFFIYLGINCTLGFIMGFIFLLIKNYVKACDNLSDYILISDQYFFICVLESMQSDPNRLNSFKRQGFEELFNINREAISKKFIMDCIKDPQIDNNNIIIFILSFVIRCLLNYKIMGFFLNSNKPSLLQKF